MTQNYVVIFYMTVIVEADCPNDAERLGTIIFEKEAINYDFDSEVVLLDDFKGKVKK